MLPSLPLLVVEDILSRLPVKPLKRFRCVAKPWNSLIDSEKFIKSHLKRSLETNSHRHLILGGKDLVLSVDFYNDVVKTKASVIKPPFSKRMEDISISCNGLFLVRGCKKNVQSVVLWNPFTRECKNLPGVGDELKCRRSNISYGFVYDSINDDYKVVRVVEYKSALHQFASSAHIYGLKLNSWRKTKNFIYPVPQLMKTDVNGALHTLLIQCSQERGTFSAKVFAFGVETERHYEVELPLGIWKKGVALSLNKIGGCLSVDRITESRFEIWVMKDYGVMESWTKILSFPNSLTINQLDDMSRVMKPLVYSKDGRKVLLYLGNRTFSWRGLKNKTIDAVPVTGLPRMLIFVEPCVESLVSLDHSKQVQSKGNSAKSMEIATLPFEVVEDILCRLPVKPLKRFRCVAKSWRLLIDSERFIKLHLKRSMETDSHHLVVGVKGTKKVFTVDLDMDDSVNDNNAKATVVKLPFSSSRVDIVSNSCNGLFLIVGEPLTMWNPFTREFKHLPRMKGDDNHPALPLESYSRVAYGFAYDPRNDDYKVVGVVEHRVKTQHNWIASPQDYIYSLKSNAWRKIEKFSYQVPDLIYPDVNGALHTLVETTDKVPKGSPAKLMAFNVGTESHYEVMLPLGLWTKVVGDIGFMLHKIGGCLSLNYVSVPGITIWVMKEYGVRESWTKMLSVPFAPTMNELELNTMKPLVYTKDGHKVLFFLGAEFFIWHDLRGQPRKHVSFEGFPPMLDYLDVCVESLVSFPKEQVEKIQMQPDKKDKNTMRKRRDGFLSSGFKLVL